MAMKTVFGASPLTTNLLQLVETDLQQLEVELKNVAQSTLPLVDDINQYLHGSGGKRLRPALLLLCSKLCGFEGDPAIRLGVVVELIHVATLVHDDIIDNAEIRRGHPSVNARWGNQTTVLMGDWLYMTSFNLALQLRDFRVLDVLIDITRKMVEGELMQLEDNHHIDTLAEWQLKVCLRKTAYLFSGCGRLGAILGQIGAHEEEKLALYGRSLGMAFQLVDDLLDYTSNASDLGKPVLKDLEEGKITLPIIYLMQRADRAESNFVQEVIRTQDFSPDNKQEIIRLVRLYGTLRDVQRLAKKYAVQARECLMGFPDSTSREALLKIPDFVVNRTH